MQVPAQTPLQNLGNSCSPDEEELKSVCSANTFFYSRSEADRPAAIMGVRRPACSCQCD